MASKNINGTETFINSMPTIISARIAQTASGNAGTETFINSMPTIILGSIS